MCYNRVTSLVEYLAVLLEFKYTPYVFVSFTIP